MMITVLAKYVTGHATFTFSACHNYMVRAFAKNFCVHLGRPSSFNADTTGLQFRLKHKYLP